MNLTLRLPFVLSWQLPPPPSFCSRPIVRRGRTQVGNLGEREREILRREREKSNKIVFFSLPFMSVTLQICNGTDTNGKKLAHIEHLMGGVFCVWSGKYAKYLAFGTFVTSAVGALSDSSH